MPARASRSASLRGRVETRRSPVHGRGVFARRRFRPGAWIGRFEGIATRRDGEHVLWLLDDDGTAEGLLVTNELRFLNHSSRPNAEIDGLDLVALRNIQAGREIRIHYGDEWDDVD